jgi:hypothetical protein
MRRRLLFVTALAITLVAGVWITANRNAEAAFPGLNGKIAFVSDRDGNLDSSATGAAAPAPPICSAEDTRRKALLRTPGYFRFCGPARAVVYVTRIGPGFRAVTETYRIRGGWCWPRRSEHQKTPRRRFGGVSIGLIANPPEPPGRAVDFRFYGKRGETPVTHGRAVTIDDSEIEVPGTRVAGSGVVVVGKKLNGGWFSLSGRDASGPTGQLVSGSWSCS